MPLTIESLPTYIKHTATHAAWIIIIVLGIKLYLRSHQPWWTLFSAAYTIELYKLVRDYIQMRVMPFPLVYSPQPDITAMIHTEAKETAFAAIPELTTHTPVVVSTLAYWDVTGVIVSLAMMWAYVRHRGQKAG